MIKESIGEHGGLLAVGGTGSSVPTSIAAEIELGAHIVQRVPETEAQGEYTPQPAPSQCCLRPRAVDESDINLKRPAH